MSFGKRNLAGDEDRSDNRFGARPEYYSNAPAVERVEQGTLSLPDIHDSHLERYWPRYAAVIFAVFAAIFTFYDRGEGDITRSLQVGLIACLISWYFLSKVKNSLNNLHKLRTVGNKSPAFKIGAGVGLAYWAYSTFISPTTILGKEIGAQTVFYDGFQRQDLGAVAQLLLSAAGYAIVGALVFSFIGKRFFPSGDKTDE